MKQYWSVIALTSAICVASAGAGQSQALDDSTLVPPIRFLGGTAAYERALAEANELMIEHWEELGFRIDETLLANVNEVLALARERKYDVVSFGYPSRVDYLDPDALLSLWQCKNIGGGNFSDWCNEEYDEVVLAQRWATDESERLKLVHKAQEVFVRESPWISTYFRLEVYAHNKERYTNVVPQLANGLYNWWNVMQAVPLTDDRIYRQGSDSTFRTINPTGIETPAADVDTQNLVYDTLTKIAPDGSIAPHLATSWTFTDDKTLDVEIVTNAKFHDGMPLTAHDVKFSYDYLKKWNVGLYVNALANIDTVTVIDDSHLQFKLLEPSAPLLNSTLSVVLILPQHIWHDLVETNGFTHPAEWTETNMIGSGPFKVGSISATEGVELIRNDDYWTEPSKSERVLTFYFADASAVWRALQDGTVYFHQSGALPPNAEEELMAGTGPAHLESGKVGGTSFRGFALRASEDSPFRDFNLRHAVAHTVESKFAVEVGLRGFGTEGTGIIPEANEKWFNKNISLEEVDGDAAHFHRLDLAKARKILEDAGFRWDDEGRLHYPENYKPQLTAAE